MLTKERENLFEGFVHASVTAIEQRDPTTSGHSHRVAQLTIEMAKIIDTTSSGFRVFIFLRIKSRKLNTPHCFTISVNSEYGSRFLPRLRNYFLGNELVLERFDHIRSHLQVERLQEIIRFWKIKVNFLLVLVQTLFAKPSSISLMNWKNIWSSFHKSNEPTVLEQEMALRSLRTLPILNLLTSCAKIAPFKKQRTRGFVSVSWFLTREEFAEIQSHVNHTYEFLRKIPWGRDFPMFLRSPPNITRNSMVPATPPLPGHKRFPYKRGS